MDLKLCVEVWSNNAAIRKLQVHTKRVARVIYKRRPRNVARRGGVRILINAAAFIRGYSII